ncbi:MAG: hypothetical protein PHO74_06055 [Weeksellaceae bacterium]|jgi:hypothetical protein|nr:hypothetical protein [Weeksellaceae bacterium]
MKKTFFITLSCLFFALMSLNANAQSAPKKSIDLKSSKVESTRGANPNIIQARGNTDEIAPASRGSGQYTCWVYFHNYTSYTIDIYVDGYYEGTLAAYSDAYVATGNGYTTVYGISIGQTSEWVFNGADCDGSSHYNFYD